MAEGGGSENDTNDSISGEYEEAPPNMRNSTDDLNRMLTTILLENRRRDDLLERILLERNSTSNSEAWSSGTNYQVMPDITKHVERCDGNKNARLWMDKIVGMKTLHSWPDAFAVEMARSNLIGGAHQWYLARKDRIHTFDDFKTAFQKTFIKEEGLSVIWEQMTQRIQGRAETVNDYFFSKLNLCVRLDLSFQETKEQILIGLHDKQLCTAMLSCRHEDDDALLQDLREYERIEAARGDRIKKVTYTQGKPEKKNETQRDPKKERKFLPSVNAEGKPLCYVCKNYGHVSKYCNKARENQKKETSQVNVEPKEKAETANQPPKRQMVVEAPPVLEKTGLKFVKQIVVNDAINSKCFVDPGSAVSTVKESFVMKNNLTCYQSNQKLYGFGSKVPIYTNFAVVLKVKVDEVEKKQSSLLWQMIYKIWIYYLEEILLKVQR